MTIESMRLDELLEELARTVGAMDERTRKAEQHARDMEAVARAAILLAAKACRAEDERALAFLREAVPG